VDWVPTSLNWSVVNYVFTAGTGVAHPADYGADVIYAGAGNDDALGGRGNDVLFGEAGDDQVIASDGDDRVQGGLDDDLIDGMGGNDVLEGGDGKDNIQADGLIKDGFMNSVAAQYHGADFVDGGVGDDQLTGGGGNDVVYGGADNDHLWGDASGKTSDLRANARNNFGVIVARQDLSPFVISGTTAEVRDRYAINNIAKLAHPKGRRCQFNHQDQAANQGCIWGAA